MFSNYSKLQFKIIIIRGYTLYNSYKLALTLYKMRERLYDPRAAQRAPASGSGVTREAALMKIAAPRF